MPDEYVQSSTALLFGGSVQERHDDPEVQVRKIALIAKTNNKVQKPPNSLNRMHATRGKHAAYNQSLLKAEEEVAGINCDVAGFINHCIALPTTECDGGLTSVTCELAISLWLSYLSESEEAK
jgi:hypothetical protein